MIATVFFLVVQDTLMFISKAALLAAGLQAFVSSVNSDVLTKFPSFAFPIGHVTFHFKD